MFRADGKIFYYLAPVTMMILSVLTFISDSKTSKRRIWIDDIFTSLKTWASSTRWNIFWTTLLIFRVPSTALDAAFMWTSFETRQRNLHEWEGLLLGCDIKESLCENLHAQMITLWLCNQTSLWCCFKRWCLSLLQRVLMMLCCQSDFTTLALEHWYHNLRFKSNKVSQHENNYCALVCSKILARKLSTKSVDKLNSFNQTLLRHTFHPQVSKITSRLLLAR